MGRSIFGKIREKVGAIINPVKEGVKERARDYGVKIPEKDADVKLAPGFTSTKYPPTTTSFSASGGGGGGSSGGGGGGGSSGGGGGQDVPQQSFDVPQQSLVTDTSPAQADARLNASRGNVPTGFNPRGGTIFGLQSVPLTPQETFARRLESERIEQMELRAARLQKQVNQGKISAEEANRRLGRNLIFARETFSSDLEEFENIQSQKGKGTLLAESVLRKEFKMDTPLDDVEGFRFRFTDKPVITIGRFKENVIQKEIDKRTKAFGNLDFDVSRQKALRGDNGFIGSSTLEGERISFVPSSQPIQGTSLKEIFGKGSPLTFKEKAGLVGSSTLIGFRRLGTETQQFIIGSGGLLDEKGKPLESPSLKKIRQEPGDIVQTGVQIGAIAPFAFVVGSEFIATSRAEGISKAIGSTSRSLSPLQVREGIYPLVPKTNELSDTLISAPKLQQGGIGEFQSIRVGKEDIPFITTTRGFAVKGKGGVQLESGIQNIKTKALQIKGGEIREVNLFVQQKFKGKTTFFDETGIGISNDFGNINVIKSTGKSGQPFTSDILTPFGRQKTAGFSRGGEDLTKGVFGTRKQVTEFNINKETTGIDFKTGIRFKPEEKFFVIDSGKRFEPSRVSFDEDFFSVPKTKPETKPSSSNDLLGLQIQQQKVSSTLGSVSTQKSISKTLSGVTKQQGLDLPTIVGGRGSRSIFAGTGLFEKSEVTTISPSLLTGLDLPKVITGGIVFDGEKFKPGVRGGNIPKSLNDLDLGLLPEQRGVSIPRDFTVQREDIFQKTKKDIGFGNIPDSTFGSPPVITDFNFGSRGRIRGFILPPIPGFGFGEQKKRRKGSRKLRRTPSLAAIGLGITSKKQAVGEVSGLVLRPIIVKSRKKKRR